jgi:hypothetical protein
MLYRADQGMFDLDELVECLRFHPQVSDVRLGDDFEMIMHTDFDIDGNPITASMLNTLDAIFIRGMHDAAILAMIEIQHCCPNFGVRLCDTDNSFDIAMRSGLTVAEVRKCMAGGIHDRDV